MTRLADSSGGPVYCTMVGLLVGQVPRRFPALSGCRGKESKPPRFPLEGAREDLSFGGVHAVFG
jgi:hypothetical protein